MLYIGLFIFVFFLFILFLRRFWYFFRDHWNRIIYYFRLELDSFPFYLSLERESIVEKLYHLHLENKRYDAPIDGLSNYQIYLTPDGIKRWYIFYATGISLLLLPLLMKIIDQNHIDSIWASLLIISSPLSFFAISYYFLFKVFFRIPVLTDCWSGKPVLPYGWFAQLPQKIKIRRYDYDEYCRGIGCLRNTCASENSKSSKSHEETLEKINKSPLSRVNLRLSIMHSLLHFLNPLVIFEVILCFFRSFSVRHGNSYIDSWSPCRGKKLSAMLVYKPKKSRHPIYYLRNTSNAQNSMMLVAMLDYFEDIASCKMLGKLKVVLLWFSPALVGLFLLFLIVLNDTIFWSCQAGSGDTYSYYSLLPSVFWFIATLLYFRWSASFLHSRQAEELNHETDNFIHIPASLRSKIKHVFSPKNYFYRAFEKEDIKNGVSMAFYIVFSILIVIIIAIHNVCSVLK